MSERARVGLIIPSSNRMVEQEMARFFPPDASPHVARLRMTGPHHVALEQWLPRVEEAHAARRAGTPCGRDPLCYAAGRIQPAAPSDDPHGESLAP